MMPTIEASEKAKQLMQSLKGIISELDEHAEQLKKNPGLVRELSRQCHECFFIRFRTSIENEMRFIARNMSPEREEALASSNAGYLSAVWAAAKSCSDVVGIHRNLYGKGGLSHFQRDDERALHGRVDIVAQGGLEWVKVIYTNEKRFFNEMATMGLFDSDDEDDELPVAEDDDPHTFLKTIQYVVEAAKYSRIRGRHPLIRLILPRIQRGSSKEVDAVLDKVAALGVNICTRNNIISEVPYSQVQNEFFPKKASILTDVVNIDINTALTTASDLCHVEIELKDSYHSQLRAWIEEEKKGPLMTEEVWPACGNRAMVCTRDAKDRAVKLAETIGTEQELMRTKLIFEDSFPGMSQEERINEFQKLSIWPVPKDWCLPIKVVDADVEQMKDNLPPVARKLCESIMPDHLHQSVFLYGWLSESTTLSAHATLSRKIDRFLDEAWENGDPDARGPIVWLTRSCRGLFGKSEQKRLSKKFRAEHDILAGDNKMVEAIESCVD